MNSNDKEIYIIIGTNLKRYRKEQGLSQQDLANKCDKVDRAKISDIENIKEDFMLSTILDIANALGKSLNELILKSSTEIYPDL